MARRTKLKRPVTRTFNQVPFRAVDSAPIATSKRMRLQAERDTAPEMTVRRALHAAGLRYRVCYPVVGRQRRSIDIAFPRQRVAVFVDGCFWHRCPAHTTRPTTNGDWWEVKLRRNAERDADTNKALEQAGWTVIRLWEHEVGLLEAVERVVTAVRPERGKDRQAKPCLTQPGAQPDW